LRDDAGEICALTPRRGHQAASEFPQRKRWFG
jgi:hypothetical protein